LTIAASRSSIIAAICLAAACASSRPASAPPLAPADDAASATRWTEEGIASWYGGNDGFEGKPTASGEIYDSSLLTAAHRELPLGTVVEVWSAENRQRVRVRINDRGPFIAGRIIDLSRAAAGKLGLIEPGTGRVRLTILKLGPAAPLISASGLWSVQIGSFADASNAKRHADRARSTGRTVSLEPYRGLTRVKVGAYPSRGAAQDVLAAPERQGFEGIVVPVN
jgi:peptidoglycan lytic transglycosylase